MSSDQEQEENSSEREVGVGTEIEFEVIRSDDEPDSDKNEDNS